MLVHFKLLGFPRLAFTVSKLEAIIIGTVDIGVGGSRTPNELDMVRYPGGANSKQPFSMSLRHEERSGGEQATGTCGE